MLKFSKTNRNTALPSDAINPSMLCIYIYIYMCVYLYYVVYNFIENFRKLLGLTRFTVGAREDTEFSE